MRPSQFTLFVVLFSFVSFAQVEASEKAKSIYKCGNLYQDRPCEHGERLPMSILPPQQKFLFNNNTQSMQRFLNAREQDRRFGNRANRTRQLRSAVRNGGCYEIDTMVDSAGCNSARNACAVARASSAGFGLEACAEMQRACARRRVCTADLIE